MAGDTVAERVELRKHYDLLDILSKEEGRRLLWRFISYCGVYQHISGPTEEVYNNLGKRQVGLYLLGVIGDADPELLELMMKEAKNQELEDMDAAKREHESKQLKRDADEFIDSFDRIAGYSHNFI